MKKFRFRRYVQKYKDSVFKYAASLTGNFDDAADITQDVLVKLWTNWDTLDMSTIRNWLLKVTKHACIDHLRKRRETVFSQMGDTPQDRSADDWADQGYTPEDLAVTGDLTDKVMTVIRALPEPLRDALILREIMGYSYQDIVQADRQVKQTLAYLNRIAAGTQVKISVSRLLGTVQAPVAASLYTGFNRSIRAPFEVISQTFIKGDHK